MCVLVFRVAEQVRLFWKGTMGLPIPSEEALKGARETRERYRVLLGEIAVRARWMACMRKQVDRDVTVQQHRLLGLSIYLFCACDENTKCDPLTDPSSFGGDHVFCCSLFWG